MGNLPQRRSIRRFDWDYSSPSTYFITITTRRGQNYFGANDLGRLTQSAAGVMVAETWLEIPNQFRAATLDRFIVMPNHLHGIVKIESLPRRQRQGIGRIVMAFKSRTTVLFIRGVREEGWPPFEGRIWHRNYYERIVYTPAALMRTRSYIDNNPEIHWRRTIRR